MSSLGQPLRWLATCGSTNTTLNTWAADGAPHGSLMVAEEQVEGRGRLGRTWHSTKGDLMFSLLLRPKSLAPIHAPPLTLLVGLSLLRCLDEAGVHCQIKWPNDLYIDGKKCAGILTEMSTAGKHVSKIVVGVGVNIKEKKELEEVGGVALENCDPAITKWSVLDGFLRIFESHWTDFQKDQSLAKHAEILSERLLDKKQILLNGNSKLEISPLRVLENGALVYLDANGEKHHAVSGELSLIS